MRIGGAGGLDMSAEERNWQLQMDTGAVAGLAVGIDGATMPDRLQCLNGGLDDLAAWLAVDGGDQADAAGVVLFGRVVETGLGQRQAIALEGVAELLAGLDGRGRDGGDGVGHGIDPPLRPFIRLPRRKRPPAP